MLVNFESYILLMLMEFFDWSSKNKSILIVLVLPYIVLGCLYLLFPGLEVTLFYYPRRVQNFHPIVVYLMPGIVAWHLIGVSMAAGAKTGFLRTAICTVCLIPILVWFSIGSFLLLLFFSGPDPGPAFGISTTQ